ncbi:MAG: hypothetical protein ACRBCJ_06435 [Hyphomicrobiaceae bacterium]
MRTTSKFASALLSILAVLAFGAGPAAAKCKNFGFLVNDYGKKGPTEDAKRLLDKHVAEWAAENGVTNYKIGKKTVTCELFIDVILFDEYTCTARANVCWGGSSGKSKRSAVTTDEKKKLKAVAKKKPVEVKEETAKAAAAATATTTTAEKESPSAATSSDAPADLKPTQTAADKPETPETTASSSVAEPAAQ